MPYVEYPICYTFAGPEKNKIAKPVILPSIADTRNDKTCLPSACLN